MKARLLFFLLFLVLYSCAKNSDQLSAKERLAIFYEKSMPESALVPFLVAGGEDLIPLLVVEMQNKGLPKRRYLIAAAGELKDERALPALTNIILNSIEEDYFRCDALKAFKQITSANFETSSNGSNDLAVEVLPECEIY